MISVKSVHIIITQPGLLQEKVISYYLIYNSIGIEIMS